MSTAKVIIPHSNHGLAKNPRPSNGRLVINNGTIAQCMAHNTDAVMPILSSFEECFGLSMVQIYKQMQLYCVY